MSVAVPLGAVGVIVVFPDHAHIFYSCEALSQQAGSHYFFLFNLCFFLK